jgi:hypothetical protein
MEEKILKTLFYKRIQTNIGPKEGFEIPKDDLIKIINKNSTNRKSKTNGKSI